MEKWLELIEPEDRVFIKRFILSSGSLKELARLYAVTYPTIRLRLDRLIEKIKVFDQVADESEFERILKSFYADGRLDNPTFKMLWEAHQKTIQNRGGEKGENPNGL